MSISKDQARMLTALAIACRPVGAPTWDEEGTFRAIGKIAQWPIGMVCEHVIAHAQDAKAKTPGVIGSSYKPEVSAGTAKRGNPKRDQECPDHPGQWPDNCAGCRVEPIAAYYDPEPDPHAKVSHADASLARAMLAQANAGLCAHGIRGCREHGSEGAE